MREDGMPETGKETALKGEGWLCAPIANRYMQLCEPLGLKRQAQLQATGLSERDLNPPSGWVPRHVVEQLMRYRLAQAPEPVLGLHLATAIDATDGGLLGFLCLSCPTIKALHQALCNFGPLISDLFSTRLIYGPGVVFWTVTVRYTDEALIRDNAEWFLASCARLIHRLDPHALLEVALAHTPVKRNGEPHPQYREAFPCPVRFRQPRSALVIHADALNRSSPLGDALVFEALTRQAQAMMAANRPVDNLTERVRRELRSLLAEGRASRAALCQRVGISSRHLHRQLQRQGSSYQKILDDLRADYARARLPGPEMSLDELASDLGFSGAKSFHRWFVGRFGITPALFRLGLDGDAGSP